MNVFFKAPLESRGLKRIENALRLHLPEGFAEVSRKEEADLVVLQIIGRRNHNDALMDEMISRGKKVALIQVSLRSTRNPDTLDWLPLWKKARLVWSYYDLPAMLEEDGHSGSFNFYHSPLGAGRDFVPHKNPKEYVVMTIGSTPDAEGYQDVWKAANLAGKQAAHLGDIHGYHPDLTYFPSGCSDVRLAGYYSQCQYVSALRRKDGFEMPAVEALLCGSRPILYDQPRFRKWFDGFAIFIPEGSEADVTKNLVALFKGKYKPVLASERKEAEKRFDWQGIIEGFWSRCNA